MKRKNNMAIRIKIDSSIIMIFEYRERKWRFEYQKFKIKDRHIDYSVNIFLKDVFTPRFNYVYSFDIPPHNIFSNKLRHTLVDKTLKFYEGMII
jgi:hypothetical protein